jgi:hypothetical protein
VFVIDQLFAPILGSEPHLGTFAVPVSPATEAVRHPDVKNRMVPVRNGIDPEVVITRHASEIRDVSTPLDMTKAHPLHAPMILPLNWIVNHLFIRVIRGSIVFGRERLYDFFEARIISERTGLVVDRFWLWTFHNRFEARMRSQAVPCRVQAQASLIERIISIWRRYQAFDQRQRPVRLID